MYPTTYQTGGARRPPPRTWLAAGGALVALLVVLFLVLAACQSARTNRSDPLAGAASGSPAPSASAVPAADGIGGNGGENPDQSDPGTGGDPGGGDPPGGEDPQPDPEDPEDPEPEPMSIEVTVFSPPPTATCHATGKIAIIGGDSQVIVTYRWYRMNLPPHHPALPQVPMPQPMQERTLPIPPDSEITISSPDFPEDDASNIVWLAVTIPDQTTSQQVVYDECSELGIAPND